MLAAWQHENDYLFHCVSYIICIEISILSCLYFSASEVGAVIIMIIVLAIIYVCDWLIIWLFWIMYGWFCRLCFVNKEHIVERKKIWYIRCASTWHAEISVEANIWSRMKFYIGWCTYYLFVIIALKHCNLCPFRLLHYGPCLEHWRHFIRHFIKECLPLWGKNA